MKFCYLDESGVGDEPYAVMVGIIADASRMHVTKAEWDGLLVLLSRLVERDVAEIHMRDLYPGNSPWRTLDGETRALLITEIMNWLQVRRHHVVYSVVDKAKHAELRDRGSLHSTVYSVWQFMALHICLSIQKYYQGYEKNKGNTVLIFDHEDREARNFIDLIKEPPDWTDTYYARSGSQRRFDQIIDVPYFGDSRHVGLIQVADVVSFLLRRHVEIQEGAVPPRYTNEQTLINDWTEMALQRAIPKSNIYPARSRCDCSNLFYASAPSCMI